MQHSFSASTIKNQTLQTLQRRENAYVCQLGTPDLEGTAHASKAAITHLWPRGSPEEVSSSPPKRREDSRKMEPHHRPRRARHSTGLQTQPMDMSLHHPSTCPSAQHRPGHQSPDRHSGAGYQRTPISKWDASCSRHSIKWGFKSDYLHSIGSSSIFIRGAESLHSSGGGGRAVLGNVMW